MKNLRYAARARCPCGAGLAYPTSPSAAHTYDYSGPFKGASYWDCSAIILGTADPAVKHAAQLQFAFYEVKSEVKSEGQPSANGATTRPVDDGAIPSAPDEGSPGAQ